MAIAKKTPEKEAIPVLYIKSRADSFRRCNTTFTKEGAAYAKGVFTDEEVERLMQEPHSLVTVGQLDPGCLEGEGAELVMPEGA